jgi:hypothetical protein
MHINDFERRLSKTFLNVFNTRMNMQENREREKEKDILHYKKKKVALSTYKLTKKHSTR